MKVRAIKIEPNRPAYEVEMEDNLEAMQEAVEGWIEITYPFDDPIFIVGNDEAKLIGKKGNRRINGAIYAGNLLIMGDDGCGGTRSLTDGETRRYLERFKDPEEISDEEVQEDIGFIVWSF